MSEFLEGLALYVIRMFHGASQVIAYKSDERIFHSQPILYVLLFGLVAAKITNRLVVSISIHLNE